MKKLLCLIVSMILLLSNVGVVMATTEGIQQGDIILLSNKSNDIAVGVCMDLGLIEGYPDGTFKGENEITRAEMTTIMVRLLGQSSLVARSETPFSDVPADHWASGYVNIAYSNKIVIGDGNGKFRPEDPVSYQEVVKMIASALGYEPAAADKGGYPTGYLVIASENGVLEDTINTGSAPASRATVAQLIYNALNAKRLTQTGFGEDKQYTYTTDTILNKYLKMETKDITIVANDIEAIDDNTKAKVGYIKDSEGNIYYAGKSDVGSKLGYLVTVYLKENKDEDAMEVLAYVGDKTTTSIVLDIAEIDTIKNGIITTIEEDKYDIPVDSLTQEAIKGKEGLITLLYHKNDDVAKYVFVKDYTTDIIEEVNTKAGKIYLKNSRTIELDEKNDDLVYSIVLNNNKAITKLSDLKKGDIISWYSSNENHYEILVSRKTVEGSVSAIGKEDDKKVYTINGDKYFGSISAVSAKLPEAPGSSGVFYLDAFGKIVTYDRVNHSATDKDYGYVIKAGVEETTFDEDTYLVKILTAEGKIKTYTIADKIYLNTIEEEENDKLVVTDNDYIELTDIDELKDLEGQVIEYGVNTNGKIIDIVVCGNGDYSLNVDAVLNRMDAPSAEYDKINNELGDFYVTKDTIVFIAPDSAKDEDYAVTNISILENEKIYNNVAFYAINDDKEVGVIVLTDTITTGNEKGNIALFVSTSTVKNDDNVTVSMIKFYENGEFVYAYCDSKEDYKLTIGDIFTYTLNDKGEITDIDIQYSAKDLQDGKSYTRPNTDEPTYVVGAVYGREDSVLKIGAIGAEKKTENHKISSEANIYMVDKTGSKIKVSVAELFDIIGNKYYKDTETNEDKFMEEEDTYFVVIKYVDKVAIDVVVYKNFLN